MLCALCITVHGAREQHCLPSSEAISSVCCVQLHFDGEKHVLRTYCKKEEEQEDILFCQTNNRNDIKYRYNSN